eukprot:TRINITY_DN56_c3_g1_i1.p1 TRINITY_DN56_c3_g1~~TRINITY_DN56_c3_g1_i1.p1  ORF type:complete len:462 (-),score=137.48 TRINITY_DN56_c3_g1_i1:55-1272(-)
MVDYAKEVCVGHNKQDRVKGLEEKKAALVSQLETVQASSEKIVNFLKDKEQVKKLIESNNFTAFHLLENFKITKQEIDALYAFTKFQYEGGKYNEVIENLHYYRTLVNTSDPQKGLQALWGKLASEILMSKWEEAEQDLLKLRDAIDPRDDSREDHSNAIKLAQSPLKQLQQRVWLLHWGLFIFFQVPNRATTMLDLYLGNDRYLRSIEIQAPWILRYMTIAAVLTKYRIKELVKFVEQESYNYSDPITEFLRFLYVKFDFDNAEKQLALCDQVLQRDYFISGTQEAVQRRVREEFLYAARLAISEVFCRIHSTIDIGMMAQKLGKPNEESERWIVNLIRNAKLDAKIDSAKNQVIVSSPIPNVYQQLQEKTKTLSVRATVLASSCDAQSSSQQQQQQQNKDTAK